MKIKCDDNMENMISEKEDAFQRMKLKMLDIKQKYGIEFDPSISEENKLISIKYSNLEYKKNAKNVTIVYHVELDHYGALVYDVVPGHTMKNQKFENIISELQKDYKLNRVNEEIKEVVYYYTEEIKNIDNKYNNSLGFKKELSSIYDKYKSNKKD